MRVLLWGVACGAAAWICASGIVRDSAGAGWQVLPYGAGLAALGLGALARRLLAAGDHAPSGRRGAGLGALVVLLSYPFTFPPSILIGSLAGGRWSFADPALGASEAAWGSLVLGLGSLLLTGWLTVPLGAGLGALLARAERRLLEPSSAAPAARKPL